MPTIEDKRRVPPLDPPVTAGIRATRLPDDDFSTRTRHTFPRESGAVIDEERNATSVDCVHDDAEGMHLCSRSISRVVGTLHRCDF